MNQLRQFQSVYLSALLDPNTSGQVKQIRKDKK